MSIIDVSKNRITIFFKSLVNKPEDPIKVLEQNVIDMQEILVVLRQTVARQIATTKRTEQQYNKNQQEANTWQQRVDLARQRSDEFLAQEALMRKEYFQDAADSMKDLLSEQEALLDKLKHCLITWESKVYETKSKKDSFIIRVNYIKQVEKIEKNLSKINAFGVGEIYDLGEIESIFDDVKTKMLRLRWIEQANENESKNI